MINLNNKQCEVYSNLFTQFLDSTDLKDFERAYLFVKRCEYFSFYAVDATWIYQREVENPLIF